MPECRKCGTSFPYNMIVDGRKRNLSNRVFCLTCSPFGARNTKPDDPARETSTSFKDWTPERKEGYLRRYYLRATERKQKLVDHMGGACVRCGYNRCLRCLTFHHRDRETRSFSLTKTEIAGYPWDKILAEAAKCDLVCLNCHMEIEDEIAGSRFK